MSTFMYPRRVKFVRPGPREGAAAVGRQGYGGAAIEEEAPLFENVRANIQYASGATGPGAPIPTSPRVVADWKIFVPRNGGLPMAPGAVTERDIAIDDAGRRYQIIAAYWNSMGWQIRATLLQV